MVLLEKKKKKQLDKEKNPWFYQTMTCDKELFKKFGGYPAATLYHRTVSCSFSVGFPFVLMMVCVFLWVLSTGILGTLLMTCFDKSVLLT